MKSEETYRIEEIITLATWKRGRIGCSEVGLGDAGIVDYITIDLTGDRLVRCYELKVSREDFKSDAKKTFIGDLNFYVMPTELYGSVRNLIEPGVGCWCIDRDGKAVRKKPAKRVKCTLDRGYITTRILLALQREHLKYVERDWQTRQLDRAVDDYSGAKLSVGSVVMYNRKRWSISEISRKRIDTVLMPIVRLSPYGWIGEEVEAKPGSVKLIST